MTRLAGGWKGEEPLACDFCHLFRLLPSNKETFSGMNRWHNLYFSSYELGARPIRESPLSPLFTLFSAIWRLSPPAFLATCSVG